MSMLPLLVVALPLVMGQLWPPVGRSLNYPPVYPAADFPATDDFTDPLNVGSPYMSSYSSYRRPYGYGSGTLGNQRAQDVAVASLINYVYDKDNFQPQGCGWDGNRNRCTDILNQCKGICKDFANDVITHDCRCVPFGYAALLGWGKK